MKNIYKRIIILTIFLVFMLATTNVFAITMARKYEYNTISLVISIIMKVTSLILLISYIINFLIKVFKNKNFENKKLILWLFIIILISFALWFSSEKVKNIGMTVEYVGKPMLFR